MILTTNRATTIDAAFESRIDITLGYTSLSQNSRVQIWREFVKRLDSNCQITDTDVLALSKIPLNGRQIKSAVKTARVLAVSENSPVTMSHLDVVINLRQKAFRALGHVNVGDVTLLRDPLLWIMKYWVYVSFSFVSCIVLGLTWSCR